MITYTDNNILFVKADAIVNTVNCHGISGAGVAKQFKILYPENFIAYETYCSSGKLAPGCAFTTERAGDKQPKYIINLATKRAWSKPSRLEWIEKGAETLLSLIISLELNSLALPLLGCGNGGLNWESVETILYKAFHSIDQKVTICLPH